MRLPDFIVIGAMKSGTSGLHKQLARRSGLFLSTPKEPNFFSDDDVHSRGEGWYHTLFAGARPDQVCGESSTHYTKLPTYPETCARMRSLLDDVKLVYVMRHPIDRMISQYIHQWTENAVSGSIDEAIRQDDRFIAYSSYARQIEPYLETYGRERILPVFFERLVSSPDAELARICSFIGDPSSEPVHWQNPAEIDNVSARRVRRSPLRDAVRNTPLGPLWRSLLRESWRARIKSQWQLDERPRITSGVLSDVEGVIDSDLTRLAEWLGMELTCTGWREQVADKEPCWSVAAPPRRA